MSMAAEVQNIEFAASKYEAVELLYKCARAVCDAVSDYGGSTFEAQTAVEDWALDALQFAVWGNLEEAKKLLERYWPADWDRTGDEPPGSYYRSEYRR